MKRYLLTWLMILLIPVWIVLGILAGMVIAPVEMIENVVKGE